jgi:hypothetical protein
MRWQCHRDYHADDLLIGATSSKNRFSSKCLYILIRGARASIAERSLGGARIKYPENTIDNSQLTQQIISNSLIRIARKIENVDWLPSLLTKALSS